MDMNRDSRLQQTKMSQSIIIQCNDAACWILSTFKHDSEVTTNCEKLLFFFYLKGLMCHLKITRPFVSHLTGERCQNYVRLCCHLVDFVVDDRRAIYMPAVLLLTTEQLWCCNC